MWPLLQRKKYVHSTKFVSLFPRPQTIANFLMQKKKFWLYFFPVFSRSLLIVNGAVRRWVISETFHVSFSLLSFFKDYFYAEILTLLTTYRRFPCAADKLHFRLKNYNPFWKSFLNSHLIPRCLKTNQNVSFFRLIRPVGNSTDRLTVKMGLKLSQIIGVDMKRQILITNVWLEQEWLDYKLKWNPADYGNVRHLHVPSQHIWLPDIVLYNK